MVQSSIMSHISRWSRPQRRLCGYTAGVSRSRTARSAQARDSIQSDYVVLGAGIIGLSCARALLQSSPDASVTVLERAKPSPEEPRRDGEDGRLTLQNTTTATGAGQGYIWMGHRDPKNEAIWKLAARGVSLWDAETADLTRPSQLGYMPQGSLIVSRDPGAAAMLRQRAAELSAEGITADVLTPGQCAEFEPLLHLPDGGVGLRVATDFQIDARSASTYLLRCCEDLGRAGGRFRIVFDCHVRRIAMDCCSGGVSGVTTSRGDVRAAKGAVIAMGCASAQVIADSFYDQMYSQLLRKRWGLLLELPYPDGVAPLRHGTMDVSYMGHYAAEAPAAQHSTTSPLPEGVQDVTFTASTSTDGMLLLGSSRHEGESMEDVDEAAVAAAIVEEACGFLPGLAPHLRSTAGAARTRSGPRPASMRGQPYIGRVPGCDGLVMAAGHEGSGLTMALSTAELVAALLGDAALPDYAESFAL
eukprot:jgi/Ulvmu1/483/UM001_0491.1